MFQHQGIWLPDGEKHFPAWMNKRGEMVGGKGTYQFKKLRAALGFVKEFRVAVDVGAHVGLWSMHLAPRFRELHAFEPMPQFRACWERNVDQSLRYVFLYPCALGERSAFAKMKVDPSDSGGTHVVETVTVSPRELDAPPAGSVLVRTLDEYCFEHVDFMKIDCEGFEHRVIAGAAETLARCKPCIIVEQKAHKLASNFGISNRPAIELLRRMGAQIRAELGGDFVLTWPDR